MAINEAVGSEFMLFLWFSDDSHSGRVQQNL